MVEYIALKSPQMEKVLIDMLEAFARSSDTVGFFCACEALAERDVRDAIATLARYGGTENHPGIHGPLGMGLGYPAARAVARLARNTSHVEVRRLLASNNIWLRAGVLAGLAEARAPGIENLLQQLLHEHQPGLIHNHAEVGLHLLGASSRADRKMVNEAAGH